MAAEHLNDVAALERAASRAVVPADVAEELDNQRSAFLVALEPETVVG